MSTAIIATKVAQDARNARGETNCAPALPRFSAEADLQRRELAVLLRTIKTMVRESP